uniref:Carboxypeptidase n=1 Tax=Lygus hesperus TaxID=30085 RepID=A0A0A9X3N4_LYGHE
MKQYLFVVSALWFLVEGYRVNVNSIDDSTHREGNPLILTPYILDGKISEGRKAARVEPFVDGVESYSGFLTVNASSNGNLFFWYFPAENAPKTAPVMIWLQGGPGGSSMLGLFFEHGPLQLKNDLHLIKRPTRWSQNIHMIYIDNPFGAGFSFTDPAGIAKTERQISENLYQGLLQFFQLFPELSGNDFFVAGESYAGKYVPALADRIHRGNPDAVTKINMKGLAIGDGVVDPMPSSDRVAGEGENDVFAIVKLLNRYLRRDDVQEQIHVNGMPFEALNNYILATVDYFDRDTKVTPWVEELLNHYRVLYYHGKDDPRLNYTDTVKFAEKLVWNGFEKYRSAKWTEWTVKGADAGNLKTGGNLAVLLVNNARHMVPIFQPERSLAMINKFVRGEPLM